MTKKDAHPSGKWLEYAKTTMARKYIRAYLEKNSLLAKLKSFGRS
jgi:(p)ppGpp synthase/HD superfamily hydrolase